jgi:protein SCO1/2
MGSAGGALVVSLTGQGAGSGRAYPGAVSLREHKDLLGLLILALCSLAVIVGIAVLRPGGSSSQTTQTRFVVGETLPDQHSDPAPRMRLTDARSGAGFDTASLAGKPYMVTFLYTHCPDVCPLIGAELQQMLSQLGPAAKRTAVVALSVDPTGDTPAAVKDWLRVHREPANFRYLIGDEGELRPYWNAWHVGPQIPGDPDSSHSAAIYLVGADGNLKGLISAGQQIPSSQLTGDMKALLSE